MDFKGLLKDRIVQVLLLVIILNVACFFLIWQLNIFVHGDLYDYGLIFSHDWAQDIWYYNILLWVFLEGATVLAALSIIPHYQHSQKPSKTTKILGFLLPTIAIIYQALSIWSLTQINSIVQNRLYDFGIPNNIYWSSTYNPLSSTALALMAVALIVLIIPAIRTLEIIKIEIEHEEAE